MKAPILITGIERSGSTIVAKVFQKCGIYTGECSDMMENLKVKHLMDNYYRQVGADRNGQFPLPIFPIGVDDWQLRVLRLMNPPDKLWMYKSFRIFQTWWLWDHAFPNAKWIVVRRRTNDIVKSCVKTGYMKAFKNPTIQKVVGLNSEVEGWQWWVNEQNKTLNQMIDEVKNVKFVWPEKMANGDFSQIKEAIEWAGGTVNDEIPNLVRPLLWKGRKMEGK